MRFLLACLLCCLTTFTSMAQDSLLNIYCISGLGADQSIFKNLKIEGVRLVPVLWIPFDKSDDVASYAWKLSAQIPEENPILLGVSFGGMIATEIAKIRTVKRVFIVSSAKDATELPPPGRFWRFMVNNGLLPVGITKVRNKQTFQRFGASTDDEKDLLMNILRNTDNGFTKWAMKAMINWKSQSHTDNIIHIHGTQDKMILPAFVKPDYWIEGGEHFMIYSRAEEIGKLIADKLKLVK